MLVHFGGYMPYDVREIKKFCKRNKIIIIEDCAHNWFKNEKYKCRLNR